MPSPKIKSAKPRGAASASLQTVRSEALVLSQRNVERRVAEELAQDERWKVIVRGNNWLCPYCLKIGARDLRMDETIEEKIALHFVRDCTQWNYFNVDPQPMSRLRQMARYLVFMGRVVRWITEDRRFRFVNDERGWVCPYCASTVAARIPEHALDDLASFGSSPEESPFCQDVARHLLSCDGFAAGEKEMRPVHELEEQRARSARRGRLDKLRNRFTQERSFQLVDQERRWLCPFCGIAQEIHLPKGGPDDDFFDAMEGHLATCKARRVLSGRPRPVEELRVKIEQGARERQLVKIRSKVSRHSLWRVRDLDGTWYCPYCTLQTLVLYPDRKADGEHAPSEREAFCQAVLDHLSGCEEYRRPKSKVASRAAMAAVIQDANVLIDRHRRIRRLLQSDALYGVTDSFSNWACPHCERVQKQIVLSNESESALFEKTISQIVNHLFEECDRYEPDVTPKISRPELETLMQRQSLHTSGVRQRGVVSPTDSLDEDTWQRIKEDLVAVKTRVERARRYESSLREARSKQMRLLPELPSLEGFEFGRVYKPCDAVGGDFYHLFKASETTFGVAIGDISGHGIEAALLMGLAKKLIEVHARGVDSPAQTLCLANRDIFSDLDERTFVTVFYGLLDTETRRFKFSRAGHDPLILYNERRTPPLQVLDSQGMALGMDEGPLFERMIEELEIELTSGDLILQYTDGVTESMNSKSEQFGQDRLYAVVEEYGRHEVEYLLWKIERAVEAFRGGEPRADDFTMVGFKVL
jgi:serine phosphatase RsbU (regulator of sigma subunit)/rubredoxin